MMEDRIVQAINAGNKLAPDKLTEFYDEWATEGSYDQVMLTNGYSGPKTVASHIARLVKNKDAKILDIGAGTGLIGEELSKLGFTNVIALDPSQKSLDVCREKRCYKDFIKSYVAAEQLPIDDSSYDAAVSSGSFFPGYCDGTSLETALRVIKPGGFVILATRRSTYDQDDYNLRKVTEKLEADGVCSVTKKDIPEYHAKPVMGVALIYTIL